jgi:hypothetical protein
MEELLKENNMSEESQNVESIGGIVPEDGIEESNLVRFARNELDRLLKDGEDVDEESNEMQKCINEDILEVVRVFSRQNHSGFSAGYALNMLKRLLDFKPIQPLTGEDDEWNECGWTVEEGKKRVFQNRRCSSVFKTVDIETGETEATYNDRYVISDNGGITWFYSSHMLKQIGLTNAITFPFKVPENPKRIYIKYLDYVPLGETSDNFVDITDAPEEIEELRKIYDRRFHPERYEAEEKDETSGSNAPVQ